MIQDKRNAAQYQCLDAKAEQQSRWRQLRPREKKRGKKTNTMGVLREDRVDPPIHTEYFHSGGATTMNFIVNGTKAVNSFIMRSTIPWNMVVPPDDTTLACNSLRMHTSHFMLRWKEVSWSQLASLLVKLGWKNTFTQWKHLNADSDEVSVCELKGLLLVGIRCRLELCVVNRAKAAQFLFDLTSNLPLCGGSKRDPLLSEIHHQILCKITVRSTMHGVMQSVNFGDVHCV